MNNLVETDGLRRQIYLSSAATLTIQDVLVMLDASGTFTVSLPKLAQAVGMILSLTCVGTTGGTITIDDNETASCILVAGSAVGSFTFDATAEWSTLFCDGYNWYEIDGGH
jgi:hypothetical protein